MPSTCAAVAGKARAGGPLFEAEKRLGKWKTYMENG